MLKHPYSKIMYVTDDRTSVVVLLMGHYTPDAIVAMDETTHTQARSMGIKLPSGCRMTILYLGADSVATGLPAILPSGIVAQVINVFRGGADDILGPAARTYIHLMEKLQVALQSGMLRDKAAYHFWMQIWAASHEFPAICNFVRCPEEFKRDVYALRAMLSEQKLLPCSSRRKKKPKETDSDEKTMFW